MTVSAEANKDVVRKLIEELWGNLDESAIERYVAPSLREASAEHFAEIAAGFSDLEVRIEDLFAGEDEKVVARLTISGTHTGPFAGVDATGKRVTWTSTRIYLVRGGHIVETWAMQDRLALLEQIGAVRATGKVSWAAGR